MRYKFYREHKYVSFAVNEVERLIAKTDFRAKDEVAKLSQEFGLLVEMLKGHAHYEDTKLHALLKKRGSLVYEAVEKDHQEYEKTLVDLQHRLDRVIEASRDDEKVELGYQFYLWFRRFAGKNLEHLHEEETVILPELQRLYTDKELEEVEAATYQVMSSEQLVEMVEVLFPHMNSNDREAFFMDLYKAVPEKFTLVWRKVAPTLATSEKAEMIQKLGLEN